MRSTEGGQPEQLVDNGYNPAVSSDESTLTYVQVTKAGQRLMKKSVGSAGSDCELLSDQVFVWLSLPRISPDGTRVALGGSGEPNGQVSACTAGAASPPNAAKLLPGLDLGALLEPSVAHAASMAHGLPSDVWSFALDGRTPMTRIADIKEDDPTLAWSPDSTRLAVFGVAALYVVESKGGTPVKLVDQGGYGGLDWTR
jgi:Tol biopolymer transport system component